MIFKLTRQKMKLFPLCHVLYQIIFMMLPIEIENCQRIIEIYDELFFSQQPYQHMLKSDNHNLDGNFVI